ncbi:hypothetical protein [Actinoplanes sp. NPDC048796]|uniref:hypothetical protein n=1 Tax=unclassified Actinoplanes TaxID=2626549 RepID=UPI0033CFC697
MTAEPFDLTRHLGEGWCVTVTVLAPALTLDMMGVRDVAEAPDGLTRASRRIPRRLPEVMLLARSAGEGSLVLQVEGTLGWIGADPDMLGELSEAGRACTIHRDPNKIQLSVAEDGDVVGGMSAVSLRTWGRFDDAWTRELDEKWTPSQCAALALKAITGVEIDAGVLDGPWLGGLTKGPTY